ncbi:hypothetical protein NE237_026154 [Protea cynaroides]|uniref:Uncharacterized protein n=1 Tax=Protea cynaroides TaxID=273540 RepID=A0A9Q0K2G3_9MAGN|nr:hypothetical protein NE237_026154 [Protea cynaroides]
MYEMNQFCCHIFRDRTWTSFNPVPQLPSQFPADLSRASCLPLLLTCKIPSCLTRSNSIIKKWDFCQTIFSFFLNFFSRNLSRKPISPSALSKVSVPTKKGED